MDASMPPQEVAMSPLMKAEFEEWGTKTTVGVLAGMMYGGLREAATSAQKEQSRLPFPQEDKTLRRKAVRDMTESKVLRISRGTVLGGAKLGAFAALFSGVQHGLAVQRKTHDMYNIVAAGTITGGAFSLTLPGSLLTRLTTAAFGSVLGATLALPLGWVQSSLQEELAPLKEQEAMQAQMAEARRQKLILGDGEAVDAVIRRLEGRVPDQPAKPDK